MIKYFMVFYDGFTYIHKLLNFRRIGGFYALSLDIYRGGLYTSHLALGVGVISAFSAFSVAIHRGAFRLGLSLISLDGFHRGACVLLLFINFFPKNIKK